MIDVKTENGIAIVTIRHGKANALDVELSEELDECFARIAESAARAVVVTGQGRIFSAGVDLIRLSSGGPDYVRKFLPVLHRAFNAMFFFPKPVVAAINGHAIAGGCVLACCADRRIMARADGRIGVTELLVGVPFPAVAFETMRFAVPARHLPELLFTGATFEVDAALERGLVDAVAPPDELMPSAIAAAEQFAALSPAAFALTKPNCALKSVNAWSGPALQLTRLRPRYGRRSRRWLTSAITSRRRSRNSSAADLKFLHRLRRSRQEFQIEKRH
jgi:enoyl-CoA hydratase